MLMYCIYLSLSGLPVGISGKTVVRTAVVAGEFFLCGGGGKKTPAVF